jgi:hypothetical protein
MHCIKQKDEFFLKAILTICLNEFSLRCCFTESMQINRALGEWWMGKWIFKQLIIILVDSSGDLSS